jgi:hypothetical protein
MAHSNKRKSLSQNSKGYRQNLGRPGVVYVLANSAFTAGLHKIGCSTRSGAARAADLNSDASTGTPALFFCVFEAQTLDCGLAEQRVFSKLSKKRTGKPKQEYFWVEIDEARKVIESVCDKVDQEIYAHVNLDIHEEAYQTDPHSSILSIATQLPSVIPGSTETLAQTTTSEATSLPIPQRTSNYIARFDSCENKPTKATGTSLWIIVFILMSISIGTLGYLSQGTTHYVRQTEDKNFIAASHRNLSGEDGAIPSNSDNDISADLSNFSREEKPEPEAATIEQPTVPSSQLQMALASQVDYFNDRTGTGLVTYSSLPASKIFDKHREYLGRPYEIRLIQTLVIEGEAKKILFFSSKPMGILEFECRFCQPILSAMLLDEDTPTGGGVVLPLQPMGTHGGWGEIRLDGEHLPSMVRVGPGKSGFVIKDIDNSQGYFEEWATMYGIEKDGFRRLVAFEVHFNGFNSEQCEGKSEGDCPQRETKITSVESSAHFGYFDLAVAVKSVYGPNDSLKRMSRKYTICFNGDAYDESSCLLRNSDR